MVKQSLESLIEYLYLDSSDHDKYGLIIHNLNSQKSLGNYQHPRTIVETINMSSNHKSNINKRKKQDHKHPKSKNNKEYKEDKVTNPLSFSKMEGRC